MHLKSLHTIWLSILTTLVLLVSSVVNSAPLMSLKMMQEQTITNQGEHCGSHDMMDMNMSPSPNCASSEMLMSCADASGMVHNCCKTSCSFVFVSLPAPENQLSPLAYLAIFDIESTDPVVQVSHDLFRPPIV
ncbi:MAG: hypothetical protein GYB40_10230 [Vibrionaceae bacterium]|nr:hypothetical protein [Vibrionaceae bacterium]